MRFPYYLILIPAVLLFHWCRAQSIEGVVTTINNSPVPYVAISLTHDVSGLQSAEQTDQKGHFLFKKLPAGIYHVETYALGYEKKTLTIRLEKDTTIHIRIKQISQSLEGLTVVGNKPVVIRKTDRVIFDLSHSVGAAGSSALEALKRAPGIKISGDDIAISGKGSVAVMQDNRLLHLSGENLIQYLKSLSANQIAQIEVITHPSAEYTAEGTGGLINIITKKSAGSGLSGSIQSSLSRFMYDNQPDYGINDYGYGDLGANLNYSDKRVSAYGSISYRTGYELEGYGIDVYYPGKHWAMQDTGEYKIPTVNFLAGMDYKITHRTTIGLGYQFKHSVIGGSDNVHVPVYNPAGDMDSLLRTYATYRPVDYSNAFNLHGIQQMGASGGKLTVNADYFNYYRRDASDFESYTLPDGDPLGRDHVQKYYDTTLQNIRIYTLKADVEWPTAFAKFLFGGKLSFINNYSNIFYYDKTDEGLKLQPALSNEYRYIENTQSVYASAMKKAGKWQVQMGIRGEITQTRGTSYFNDQKVAHDYFKIFPSFLGTYTVNEKNAFSLAFDKRIDRPDFWSLNPYKSLMTAYSYVEGNPYLQPEYISNIEMTYHYKDLLHSSVYFNITNNGFAQVTYADADSNNIHTTPLNCIRTDRIGISESITFQLFSRLESNNQVNVYYSMVGSKLPYIRDINGWGAYVATNNVIAFNKEKTLKGLVNLWCQFPEISHFGKSDTYYQLDLGIQASVWKKQLDLSLMANDLSNSSASVTHSTVNQIRQTFTNFQVYRNIKVAAVWYFNRNHPTKVPVQTGNESERSRAN